MKRLFKKEDRNKIISLFVIAFVFVLAAYLTQRNEEAVRALVAGGGKLGVLIYILITVLAIVAAPLTSIPLIPLAVRIWGIFPTSVFSVIGWTLGSLGAFWVARKFGVSLVSKIESVERIRSIAERVPKKKMFWYLIFLRMTIPVDVLSYALGLFTGVSWKMFFITTFLGVIPVTFVFSYVGSLPVGLQAPLVILGIGIIVSFFYFHSRRNKI